MRWVGTVSSTFQQLHYYYMLPSDVTILISHKCPDIGEKVVVILCHNRRLFPYAQMCVRDTLFGKKWKRDAKQEGEWVLADEHG